MATPPEDVAAKELRATLSSAMVHWRDELSYKSTAFDGPPAVSLIKRQPAAAQKQASNKRDT
jgi:hypothetical protein